MDTKYISYCFVKTKTQHNLNVNYLNIMNLNDHKLRKSKRRKIKSRYWQMLELTTSVILQETT